MSSAPRHEAITPPGPGVEYSSLSAGVPSLIKVEPKGDASAAAAQYVYANYAATSAAAAAAQPVVAGAAAAKYGAAASPPSADESKLLSPNESQPGSAPVP